MLSFIWKELGEEEPASLILVLPKQVSPQSNHKYVEENRPEDFSIQSTAYITPNLKGPKIAHQL